MPRGILLILLLSLASGCVVVTSSDDCGCDAGYQEIGIGKGLLPVSPDSEHAPIPDEAIRRLMPPPEPQPPGRFSPVPVRPVFAPQTESVSAAQATPFG